MLFSDIEGSTRLLGRLGDRYAEALDVQRSVLRSAWRHWGGVEMGTEGDSFFVVFEAALAGVSAALDAQRGLMAQHWPAGQRLAVRMGLHTGEPVPHDGGYVGIDVHRAARISAAAHGGQVVITAATRELVAESLSAGAGRTCTARSTSTGRSSTCRCRLGATCPLPGSSSPMPSRTGASTQVTTDRASAYPRVLDELAPAALHDTERYANNRVGADHGRLKARLRPMRGMKTLRGLSTVARGHAFVQNLRRGHYELATHIAAPHRLRGAFDELVLAI